MISVMSAKFACSTCGRKYQHSSHLRRHENAHLDGAGFRCGGCDGTFARRDVWRKHILRCANVGQMVISPTKRGRKPQVCDTCFRSRLACDTQTPCSRCEARGVKCTYDRLSGRSDEVAGASGGALTQADDNTKISISFLLNLTDPSAESMVESILLDQLEPPSLEPVTGDVDFEFLDMLQDGFLTDDGFFPWNLGCPQSEGWASGKQSDMSSDQSCHDLAERAPTLARIIQDLQTGHLELSATDKTYNGTFDIELARRVFTISNRDAFVEGYFRITHLDFPMTHRPSFNVDTVSPGLLLAFFLCGSMYVPIQDGISSTKGFFRLAEEYVFRDLDEQIGHSGRPAVTARLLETLQAALLVHCLQYSMKCDVTRRRNRILRLPKLVSAVRILGFAQICHQPTEHPPTWREFVQEETKLRIATWTMLADWQQGGMFHVPPMVTTYEMTGDFPCLPELWEADTAAEFEATIASKGKQCWKRTASIRQAVESLMSDKWQSIEQSFPLQSTTIYDLNLLVYALHTTGRTALLMGLLPTAMPALSRAASRWQDLWREAAGRLSPEELRRGGLARHGPELCWLARKFAEAAASGDTRLTESSYLSGVAHESIDELHAVIKRLRDL